MVIRVECEDCFSVYQVRDEKAGGRVRCKSCGAVIEVPDVWEDADAEEEYDDGPVMRSTSRRKSSRQSGSSNGQPLTILLILGGAGVALVLMLIVGVVMARSLFRNNPGRNVAQRNIPNGFPRPGDPNFPAPGRPPVRPPTFTPPTFTPPTGTNPFPRSNTSNGGNSSQNSSTSKPPSGFRPAEGAGGKSVATVSDWSMTVDPLSIDISFDASRKLNIPIPGGGGVDDVVYPSGSNAFVALGRNNNSRDLREFWNLQTGKKIGSLTGVNGFTRSPALSPDGAHFAAEIGGRSQGVVVWETKTGKPLGELAVSDSPGFIRLVDFAGAERLVAMPNGGPIRIWKIPSGDFERDIEVPRTLSPDGIAFSPNGRYMLMNSDWSVLEAVDLTTGEVVGKLTLPKIDFGTLSCDSLLFSPDGTEFGGLFNVGSSARLLMFDTATGKLTIEHIFEENPRSVPGGGSGYKGRKVEWFADGNGWLLYGHAVVDRKIGGPVFNAPSTSRVTGPRRVLDNDRIAVIVEAGNGAALVALEIPHEDIVKAKDIVKSGGLAVDAGLPPLTAANLGSTKLISADVSAPWKLTADPAPQATGKLDSNIPIKSDEGTFRGILLTRADVGQGIVWIDSLPKDARPGRPIRPNFPGRPGSGPSDPAKPLWLDRYDLATGKKTGSTTIPVDSELIAYSPDGKVAACVISPLIDDKENRIDVWTLEDGSHVAGFRPYADQEERNQKITASAFLDETRLITVNSQGMLTMWQLPECQAVYRMEGARTPRLSPGGKYLSVAAGDGVRFFVAATGEPAGGFAAGGSLQAMAFSADGSQFAGIVSTGGGDTICARWDLAKGEMIADFFLPKGGSSLEFCGSDHLLMNNDSLIDLKQEKIAWRYQLTNGQHLPFSPDGRHWYIAGGRSARDNSIALCAAELPEQQVVAKLASTTIPDEALLKPGAEVSLQVNLSTLPPNKQDLPQEVTARFRQELERNGFKVTPNAPIVIQVGLTYGGTGKTEEYRFFGAGQGNVTVQETKVESSVKAIANGNAVWDRTASYLNTSYFVSLPKGTDLQTYLAQNQWKNAMNYLLNFTMPSRIFPNNAGKGIGQSTFVAGGVSTGN